MNLCGKYGGIPGTYQLSFNSIFMEGFARLMLWPEARVSKIGGFTVQYPATAKSELLRRSSMAQALLITHRSDALEVVLCTFCSA
jgi:hypothetical protein